MASEEAIQVQLGDNVIILYPGSPDDPPATIRYEDVVRGDYRVFDTPNPNGPLFVYDADMHYAIWTLRQ